MNLRYLETSAPCYSLMSLHAAEIKHWQTINSAIAGKVLWWLTFQAVQVFGKQKSEHKYLTVKIWALTELYIEEDIQTNSADWNNESFCFLL